MKLIKQVKILLLKNLKIVIGILISIVLSYVTFYLDIFDLDLFNKKNINFEPENIQEKFQEDLKKIEDEVKQKFSKTESNMVYYAIGSVALITIGFFIFYYFNTGGNNEIDVREILQNLHESEAKAHYDSYSGKYEEMLFPPKRFPPDF